MTVSTTQSRIEYIGNGVTTVFSFPYKFLADADLVVIITDSNDVSTTQTITTDYTVTGAGAEAGGSVTMVTPPASTDTLLIYRDTAITQDVDYISGESFPAETHEGALDKLTLIAQDLDASSGGAGNRNIRFPDTYSGSSALLPNTTTRKNKYMRFDDANGDLELVTLETILSTFPTEAAFFDVVSTAKTSNLVAGTVVYVRGYSTIYDGGINGLYVVKTSAQFGGSPDDVTHHSMTNGNVLVLIGDDSHIGHSGGLCTGADEYAAFNSQDGLFSKVKVNPGTHTIGTNISLTKQYEFDNGAIIKPINGALIKFTKYYPDAFASQIFDLSGVIEQEIVATSGQTVFNLSNAYVVGSGNLFVYYDGMLMDVTTGYTETNTTTVTTTFGIPAGVTMKFKIGGIQFGNARNDFADIVNKGKTSCCPEHFGALGVDNSSDDTAAVQACLDAKVYFEFYQRYNVTQVTIDGNERRGNGNSFQLIGVASSSTSSVLELKCGWTKDLHNIRVDQNFNTNYEVGIHYYTNLLPGNITGVYGYSPGNNGFDGFMVDGAVFPLYIGALPSQITSANITGISNANPAVVTFSSNPFSDGAEVLVKDVFGMEEVNDRNYTLASCTGTTAELSGVDSTGWGAWSSGGTMAEFMPGQSTTTAKAPTAINAPLSESHFHNFKTQNCLNPVTINQSNGKLTFSGSVASPAFGSFSTGSATSAIKIGFPNGGEIHWCGGAVENVIDSSNNGELLNLGAGNLYIEGAVMESVTLSYLSGPSSVRISKCPNLGYNTNNVPFFAVHAASTARINIDNQRLEYPANRMGVGTNPMVKMVSSRALSFKQSNKFVGKFTDCEFRDIPFWNQYSPVEGGRAEFNGVQFDSIPAAGRQRDVLHRIRGGGKNLLSDIIDVPATTITAYPQTASGSSGGYAFTVSTASNSWGSDTTVTPGPELLPISKGIRLTTVAGQSAYAISAKFDVEPSKSYIFDCWSASDGGGATVIYKVQFYKFDGTASATTHDNFISGASSMIGSIRPIQGLFKTPADCTQAEFMIYAENGAELYTFNPSITG